MRNLQTIRDTRSSIERVSSETIYSEPRVIDVIVVEAKTTPLGQRITHVGNDIALFRDQQKIIKYNPTVVQAVLSEFRAVGSPYTEALKGLPDEDILNTVKSRYIQSTTDVSQYVKQLEQVARSTIEDYVTAKQAAVAVAAAANVPTASE